MLARFLGSGRHTFDLATNPGIAAALEKVKARFKAAEAIARKNPSSRLWQEDDEEEDDKDDKTFDLRHPNADAWGPKSKRSAHKKRRRG